MEERKENNRNNSNCGRPKKEKEKLNRSINLKLTAEDFDLIKEKATKLGMKATQYVRETVLKGKVKSRFTLEELDLMRKLSGEANNLNQIARKANQAGFANVAIEIIGIMTRIKRLLDEFFNEHFPERHILDMLNNFAVQVSD
jgi:predicted DNA binding CopG/RHH family protein